MQKPSQLSVFAQLRRFYHIFADSIQLFLCDTSNWNKLGSWKHSYWWQQSWHAHWEQPQCLAQGLCEQEDVNPVINGQAALNLSLSELTLASICMNQLNCEPQVYLWMIEGWCHVLSHCLCSWQRPACCWRGSHTMTQWSPVGHCPKTRIKSSLLFLSLLSFLWVSLWFCFDTTIWNLVATFDVFHLFVTFWSGREWALFVDKTYMCYLQRALTVNTIWSRSPLWLSQHKYRRACAQVAGAGLMVTRPDWCLQHVENKSLLEYHRKSVFKLRQGHWNINREI